MSYTNNTIVELKSFCRERGIPKYSTKKKNDLIAMLESYDKDPTMFQSDSKRSKARAKANEAKDLDLIVTAITNNTPAGQKIKKAFLDRFGKELKDVRKLKGSGTNNTHYDFEILVDSDWETTEHKGSNQCKPIDSSLPPWTQGVQFFNGIAGKYTVAKLYSRIWYDRFISSGHISKKYGLVSEIPTYTDWFEKDVLSYEDPKTAFGMELRTKLHGSEQGGCFDERDEMTKTFAVSNEDLETVKKEILTIAQNALKQKKYWLQIQGDLNGEFHCAWYPGLVLTKITKIEKDTACSDVQFFCECDMGFNFKARLRWGKGQGFSNLRIDLR